MKIAYLSGPAKAAAIHEEWQNGTQEYFGSDYMKQFIQLTTDLDAESWVVTWHAGGPYQKSVGAFTFDNRPLPELPGIRYFIGQIWWHMKLWPKLIAFRPDILVLTGNQLFWWTLAWTRLFGTQFVPTFHCTLWRKFETIRRLDKILLALERVLVFRHCKVIVVTSHDIARQVEQITDTKILYHLPSYSEKQFADIPAAEWGTPFHVIFMGRMEESKGVFDVLEMARRLPHCHFDMCGTGNDQDEVRAKAPDNVTLHGFCNQARLKTLLGRAHVSVVPTRSDFEAGFEMTCAEAILAGRPLVTSAACPALEYLRPAAVEVPVDDVDKYVEAIDRLSSDHAFYESKRLATQALKGQFYDPANSWLAKMKDAIALSLARRV